MDPRNHLFYLITMDSMPRGREDPQGTQLISGRVPMKQDLLLSSEMLLHNDRPPIVNSHTSHAMLYFCVCV